MIIKRIYFPDNIYRINNEEFKKILIDHGLVWNKDVMRTYVSKE